MPSTTDKTVPKPPKRTPKPRTDIKEAMIAETRLNGYRQTRNEYMQTLSSTVRRILIASGTMTEVDIEALRELEELAEAESDLEKLASTLADEGDCRDIAQ